MEGKTNAVPTDETTPSEEDLVIEFVINDDGTIGYPDCSYLHMAFLGLMPMECYIEEKKRNPDWDGMGICG